MKPSSHDMLEGQPAFDRFRKAMKTIVSVPKNSVLPDRPKKPAKPKRQAKP